MDFNWGPAGASCSVKYRELLISRVHAVAKRNNAQYAEELHLVSSSRDLAQLLPKIRGRKFAPGSVGFYFLWPTQFKDGPNLTPESCPGGYVEEAAFFKVMVAAESNGVKSVFPHKVSLYRQLVSKNWQARLCSKPNLRIAPTVFMRRADLLRKATSTTTKALERLRELPARRQDFKPNKVVCKLGFSWEALDVRACEADKYSVRDTALALLRQTDCFSSGVIVQKHVNAVFELRCFVVNGEVAHHYCARYASCEKSTGYFGDWETHPRDNVITKWLSGDELAYQVMLAKARETIGLWNIWLITENAGPVPAIRMDFLVCYDREHPGQASVYTLELTELGFSMWNWAEGHETVFEAVAQSCLKRS